MRKRLSTWSRVFLITVGSSAATMVAGVFVVERFPWQTVYTDFSLARVSQFLTPWPQSALEEEMQERKRLKRYARPEVERRFQLQLKRMDLVRTPIFEPFLDPGTQLGIVGTSTAPQPGLHFPWPSLQTARVVGEPGASRPVSYFVVPMVHGSHLVEGISVAAGEELRFSFPIVANRRTLDFVAIPLSPGTVRGMLGQYSWVRNFADSDVHRFQIISIPVNDSTASSLRITSQSTRFLFLGAMVSQWDRTGRLPVQVSSRSPLWEADPALLRKGAGAPPASDAAADATAPDTSQAEGQATSEAAVAAAAHGATEAPDAPEASATPGGGGEKAAGGSSGSAGVAGSAGSAGVAVTDSGAGPAAAKSTKDGDAKETAPKTPDPLEEVANAQALTQGRTAAVGYNVLLLQFPPLPDEVLSQPRMLAALMPHLAALLEESVVSRRAEVDQDSARALFHRTILSSGTEDVATSTPVLLRRHLEGNDAFNLYGRMRNFGYRVLSMAPAPFLGLSETLGAGRDVPPLDRRWLGVSDWPFAQRNKELDEQSQPVSGLDAIFQTNSSPLAPPLGDSELERIGGYLAEVGRVGDSFVDWRSNEIFLPDTEGLYLPSLVDFFQKWTKDNAQTRFLAHAYLDTGLGHTRPSMKDLFHVVKARKIAGLTSRDEAEKLARLVLLDRALHQVLETLRARKLTHRTVVGMLLPHASRVAAGAKDLQKNVQKDALGMRNESGALLVTAALSIPGLKPKTGGSPRGSGVDDLVATLLTSVGIPLGRNVEGAFTAFPGASWELPRGDDAPVAEGGSHGVLKRYVVYLKSGSRGCAPLTWRSDEDVFGFEASHPIVEFGRAFVPGARGGSGSAGGTGGVGAGSSGSSSSGVSGTGSGHGGVEHFRVFPCSLPGTLVKLSWFQAKRRPGEARGEGETASTGDALAITGEAGAERKRPARVVAPLPPDPLEELSRLTLRGFFSVRKADGAGGVQVDLPLFFFGRNALRLGALPMTLSSLDEREVARVFDVEENEVPDARLAGDMLALSQFNGARTTVAGAKVVVRADAKVSASTGEARDRSALLVFRHGVHPESTGRFTRAER